MPICGILKTYEKRKEVFYEYVYITILSSFNGFIDPHVYYILREVSKIHYGTATIKAIKHVIDIFLCIGHI